MSLLAGRKDKMSLLAGEKKKNSLSKDKISFLAGRKDKMSLLAGRKEEKEESFNLLERVKLETLNLNSFF